MWDSVIDFFTVRSCSATMRLKHKRGHRHPQSPTPTAIITTGNITRARGARACPSATTSSTGTAASPTRRREACATGTTRRSACSTGIRSTGSARRWPRCRGR